MSNKEAKKVANDIILVTFVITCYIYILSLKLKKVSIIIRKIIIVVSILGLLFWMKSKFVF